MFYTTYTINVAGYTINKTNVVYTFFKFVVKECQRHQKENQWVVKEVAIKECVGKGTGVFLVQNVTHQVVAKKNNIVLFLLFYFILFLLYNLDMYYVVATMVVGM